MSNKIEIDRIQETYARMYDEELLDFAKNEGLKISADALLALKNELTKRNIGADTLQSLEHEIILQASLNHKRLTENINNNLFLEALEFSLTQKQKGVSDYEIYAGLIEMGVNEEYSNYMVNKLQDWTERLHEDSKTEFQAGIGTVILGAIALYVTLKIERFEAGAFLIILTGIGRIILSSGKKRQFRKILSSIQAETEKAVI